MGWTIFKHNLFGIANKDDAKKENIIQYAIRIHSSIDIINVLLGMSDIDDTIINYQYTSVLQDTALHWLLRNMMVKMVFYLVKTSSDRKTKSNNIVDALLVKHADLSKYGLSGKSVLN